MPIIKSVLKRDEASRKIVEIIVEFYTSDREDIIIGFTSDGRLDYHFVAHGGDVVLPVYETKEGWHLGDTKGKNPATEEYWTYSVLTDMVKYFATNMDSLKFKHSGINFWVEFPEEEQPAQEITNEQIWAKLTELELKIDQGFDHMLEFFELLGNSQLALVNRVTDQDKRKRDQRHI